MTDTCYYCDAPATFAVVETVGTGSTLACCYCAAEDVYYAYDPVRLEFV
jgi:hypothetical protein